MTTLENLLQDITSNTKKYTFGDIDITAKPISGTKVGYASGASKGTKIVTGYIVIDSRFIEYCKDHEDELVNTIKHELSHLIAETFNKKKSTGVWHGQAWKEIFIALGGNGDRYYKGTFVKPENKNKEFKTMAELYATLPTQPATDWERGTYRQWLSRGYHVIKGQKGQLATWEFSAQEYETDTDGKASKWGRTSAVYFDNTQVEANTPK